MLVRVETETLRLRTLMLRISLSQSRMQATYYNRQQLKVTTSPCCRRLLRAHPRSAASRCTAATFSSSIQSGTREAFSETPDPKHHAKSIVGAGTSIIAERHDIDSLGPV